jgi:nucleoside 2-deoxyribosyltransferase
MKIYVASSWRNQEQQKIVQILEELGHEVYDFKHPRKGDNGFHWSQIDIDWKAWTPNQYVKALEHPIAIAAFKSDFDAMERADCCVIVLPCGRSAHTEAGYMKGAGKPVYVYQSNKEEPELMYNIYDMIITSFNAFAQTFRNLIIEENNNEWFYIGDKKNPIPAKPTNIEIKFDNGTIIDYNNDNWPWCLVTHWRNKTEKIDNEIPPRIAAAISETDVMSLKDILTKFTE